MTAGTIKEHEVSVDLSLYGILRLRLVDPLDKHIDYLSNRLGATLSTSNDPDLTIRFVAELEPGPTARIGLVSAAYSDTGFYLIDPDTGRIDARIPFGELDTSPEVLCRSDLRSPPLLMELIRLLLVTKDHVAVHASGFSFKGLGILAMGWAKGGKTGAMLAFAKKGAAYVGDEWVILTPGASRMYGFPKPIGVAEPYLSELPDAAADVTIKHRLWFGVVHLLERLQARWKDAPLGRLLPRKTLSRALPHLQRRLRVWVHPGRIFETLASDVGVPPRVLVLMLDDDGHGVDVSEANPSELARRMSSVSSFEWRELRQAYHAYRFAFPNRTDALIEGIEAAESRLLQEAFAGKSSFYVTHSYPGTPDDLFAAIEPYLFTSND